MPRTGLKRWPDIAKRYTSALLIGNGASIAFSQDFRYSDILAYARLLGVITPEIEALFRHFDTSDFELVLRYVWQAHELNLMLNIRENETERAYDELRSALIQIVRRAHPPYQEVGLHLPAFAGILRHFDTVVSLNYDLLLYWAHMYSNDTTPDVVLKDCFIDGAFRTDWRSLRRPLGTATKSVLVFYPHGNLALAVTPTGLERKIHVTGLGDLLSQVERSWQADRWLPLFVSEGTANEKLSSIYRSPYLSTVIQDVLPNIGVSLAVFGWSFPDADDHILRSLLAGNMRRIAISVHTANPDWRDSRESIRRKIRRASRRGARPEIEFFDAGTMPFTSPQAGPPAA